MRKLIRLSVTTLAALLFPIAAFAQGDGVVTGRVVDSRTQSAIQAAQVTVVGTQLGAMTNQQGEYSIRGVPAGQHQIRVRSLGYAPLTQTVTVGAGATASTNFSLATAALRLDEVVISAVTGQAERKVESGTNIGRVNVGNLNKGPITKMADVLQGRVAGVTLQSAAGTTGGSQRIRIRGANSLSLSNEPLIYVDGVRISNGKGGFSLGGQDYSRLNDLNPDEIENIDILKGPAAAALYGSVANNGVILITTRKGRAGAAVWRAYAETGQLKDRNDYPVNWAALQAFDATAPHYRVDQGGILNTRSFFAGAPYAICPNYLAATNSCTQDVTLSFDQFRDARTTPFFTGRKTKFGLNVAGGSDVVTYFISGDKERENGVMRPNDIDRVSLRSNLTARMGSRATATVTAGYVRSDTRRLSNDNSVFSQLINAYLGPAEYVPGMESDTVARAGARLASFFGWNSLDQRKVFARQLIDRVVLGSNANYTPLSWLRFNGNAGLDYYGRFDRQTINPNELPLAQSYVKGWRSASRASNYEWTSSASAVGTFSLRPELISTTTVGGAFERSLFQNADCYGEGIPAGTNSCGATTSSFAVDEAHTDLKTVGGFARQEFAWADRLFVSGSIRADNNSGLVRDVSGLAYYPAVNGSWVVSRESFFPQVAGISQLRLRAAWGQAGQRPGFGDAETFFAARVLPVGGAEVPALILTRTGNPALKVERTTEIEGGFDVGFLDDRVTGEFTAFRRRSQDALVSRPLAPSAGLTTSVFQNLGSVKNWGTEMGLGANILDRDNFGLTARLTASTLRNKIENLGDSIAPIVFNRGRQQHRQNFPTGAYFARPYTFADADGNGKLSRSEVKVDSSKFLIVPNVLNPAKLDTLPIAYVGPLYPTNSQSLSFDVTLFRTVTVSSLFERRAGHKQMNETEFFRCRTQDATPAYGQCDALSNPNASLEQQAAFIASRTAFTEFGASPYGYMEDATFVKWRELSVKFSVPEKVGARIRSLQGASIALSGRNLKTWTDYTGLDPEINETGGGTSFTQAEFNTQPPVRVYSLRFDFRL